MIAANQMVKVSGATKAEQRRRILALMDHHLKQVQDTGSVGKLVIEVEAVRGGNLKSPHVEYKYIARWRFLDKVEGLG